MNLVCYLDDHLAGAGVALEIFDTLERNATLGDGRVAIAALRREVKDDEQTLLALRRRFPSAPGGWKRRLARWTGKLMRRRFSVSRFGAFEAVEALSLGVRGKAALWDALATLNDPRLETIDLALLKRRASSQHTSLEQLRLALAVAALTE